MPNEGNNGLGNFGVIIGGIIDVFDKNPQLKEVETEDEFNKIVANGLIF